MSRWQPDRHALRTILVEARTVAVVGFSARPSRFSHVIARYLADQGYRVWGVNPALAGQQIAGIEVVARIQDVPVPVDLVDVFRRPEHVPQVLEDALAAGVRVFWMQDGVVDPDSAARAEAAGLTVVMDDCPLRQHRLLRLPRR